MRRFAALALLLLPACSALVPSPGRPRGPEPLQTDTGFVRGVLPNGLSYYLRVNREPPGRAELRLVVNVGSVLESEDQRGLAHVVEHMAFNGTTNFARQELIGYLEGVGMRFGPHVNAYTSFDETVYMLALPTDSAGMLEKGIQILEDWAHGVTFDSTEVEKERGVVIEEWRLGQGAGSRMHDRQFPLLVSRSRYADRLPIGTFSSLRTFDQAALRRFYRDWYRPELMAVVAVGDFDPARVEELIREHFGRLRGPERPPSRVRFAVPGDTQTVVSIVTDPEATATSISVYLKREPTTWTDVAAFRRWLVESLASGMLTNRLSERTQRPGAPFMDVSSFQGRFLHPLAVYMLNVKVPARGVERGLDELLLEMERVDRHGFTRTELERERREILRRAEQRYLERDKTTSATFAADYVSNFSYGGTLLTMTAEYELYRRLLPQITLAEVDAIARDWIGDANRVVLVTAPQQDSVAVPEERRLRAIIRGVRRRPVSAYVDSLSEVPLLRRPPEPGRIVSERRIEAVGVTEWTLENGVRVLLRPTDFRADEVLLAGRSPGGTSLVSDADYFAAVTAAGVVQAGGLGELSGIELRKRLSGTLAGVGADISEMAEGISGGGSSQDLETLLQLVHLKFTSPRLDTVAVEAYRAQARVALANRSANPEQVFLDSLRAALTQNHPRARPLSAADFDRLDPRRSFEIYRDRFADASDFTFYLVGNLDLDAVRPLVERYLGSLPALRRVERARDVGVRAPGGVVRKVVRGGIEAKAATQMVFYGGLEFSRESLYSLNALAEVLQLRLRESLREDRSGTYGVQVGAGAAAEPVARYQLSVGFGSDPERADELTAVVMEQIDALKRAGPTPQEVGKVREMELRSRETDLRENQFWIGQLLSYDRHGWDMAGILAYPDWIGRLDAEVIRAAAIRFLDTSNHLRMTLLPQLPTPTAPPR